MDIIDTDGSGGLIEDLQKENRLLKRKLDLAEKNLSRAQMLHDAKLRVESFINQSIRREQQFFQLVLDNTTNVMLLLDVDGSFAYASKSFLDKTNIYNYGIINGLHYTEVLTPIVSAKNLVALSTAIEKAIVEKSATSYEEQVENRIAGTSLIYTISVIPMLAEGDRDPSIMILLNEITDIRRQSDMLNIANEKLLKTSVQLESALVQANAASKAKGDFLSNMSHEMRTPLNTIIGMTTIGKKTADPEDKDNSLNRIEEASTHLLAIINNVLDMAKIEANKLELSPVEFVFDRMLQKVLTVASFRADEKEQTLLVNVDHNIPRLIIGDDKRLAQVLTNLLANAIKFTPEGGKIIIDASLADEIDDECSLLIEITDTGIGISPQQQTKLFQAFEQADSGTSREFGGTGLGLAISKNLIELMGGRLWVDSELGKGSKFSFTIKTQRGKNSAIPLLSPHVNWDNIRVLAVDDMVETRNQFETLFTRLNIKHDVASDGFDALRLIEEKGNYDVYFIDWRMPGMDGIELTRRIKSRENGRQSVVIMITVMDWDQIKIEAVKAGVDKYVLKPLVSSTIIDCVNECLASYRPYRGESVDAEYEFYGKKMLLAEDVAINREVLMALLEHTGLAIDYAENGIEAVNMIEAAPEKYDIVFMDVQMPKMDGHEATRQIRTFEDKLNVKNTDVRMHIPIVAMTANVFKEDIEKCLAAGMNDHLGKPLDINEVMVKLKKYLR